MVGGRWAEGREQSLGGGRGGGFRVEIKDQYEGNHQRWNVAL